MAMPGLPATYFNTAFFEHTQTTPQLVFNNAGSVVPAPKRASFADLPGTAARVLLLDGKT